MAAGLENLGFRLHYNENGSFILSGDESMPVNLKKYGTIEKAKEAYKKVQNIQTYHMAYCFPPAPIDGSIESYIAISQRGVSLKEYLKEAENLEKMFVDNDLKSGPNDEPYKDHVTEDFKSIVRYVV